MTAKGGENIKDMVFLMCFGLCTCTHRCSLSKGTNGIPKLNKKSWQKNINKRVETVRMRAKLKEQNLMKYR